ASSFDLLLDVFLVGFSFSRLTWQGSSLPPHHLPFPISRLLVRMGCVACHQFGPPGAAGTLIIQPDAVAGTTCLARQLPSWFGRAFHGYLVS
ncbi:hypothetical protein, partial [Desulfofundulus sp.]|uniref:hypothetical protein n=1 Tax=Desulfofundulus sp. TaxID=2282750 RepID=UPI003C73BE73